MTRQVRRAARKSLASDSKAYTRTFRKIPESEWPSLRTQPPSEVWRNHRYLVQVYQGRPADLWSHRLTVCRTAINTRGQWLDGITWEELQWIKNELGYADRYGIEVYPREDDEVNVANMRHVWLLREPLAVGWTGPYPDAAGTPL